MFYVVYSTRDNPLMTIGDAIASFLAKEDTSTERFPFLTLHECEKGHSAGIKSWSDMQYRWKDTVSRNRRIVNFAMQVPSNLPVCKYFS
jgi:hypothetical protein